MVALSAAHGYAQVSGRAQAVIVHVECGTQSLAGAVHNAARGRVPVFIFAGMSPFTQEGELPGSRNEFIQWIQDVGDQRGIVREYMKYDNELRTGRNVKQIVHRAMQFAHSDPQGPGLRRRRPRGDGRGDDAGDARPRASGRRWRRSRCRPTPSPTIVAALARAHRPLVVTSYVGRTAAAVEGSSRFCNRLGVGVLESVPCFANYPHDDALYQGNHWNHPFQNRALAEADVVLVIDSDVPWIPTVSRPPDFAAIYHIDIDPLKESMPLWYINARASFRADAATALRQMNAHLDGRSVDRDAVAARLHHFRRRHGERAAELAGARGEPERRHHAGVSHRRAFAGRSAQDAIVLSEGITNYPAISDHIAPSEPGTFFASGGGSLGWNGGAAIGAKLAAPERTVVAR